MSKQPFEFEQQPITVNLPEFDVSPTAVVPENNDKPVTPADLMTFSRPIWGVKLGVEIARGSAKNAFVQMLGLAATDAEGQVARGIDRIKPGTGYGTTEHGAKADPVADTIAFASVGIGSIVGALRGKKTSILAALGSGIVLGKEMTKAGWMAKESAKFKKETGDTLAFNVVTEGKESTGLAFGALALGALTHDLPKGRLRTVAGIASVGLAIASVFKGEKARSTYKKELPQKYADAKRAA